MVGAFPSGAGAPRDAEGRFTNSWPSWGGDKGLLEVLQFGRQMRGLGVPNWGYLSNNRRPTREDLRCAPCTPCAMRHAPMRPAPCALQRAPRLGPAPPRRAVLQGCMPFPPARPSLTDAPPSRPDGSPLKPPHPPRPHAPFPHPRRSAAFPVHAPDYPALSSPPPGAVSLVWAGHASVLVALEGLTFLTDPVFAPRASPLSWLGPERAAPSAVRADDPGLRVDAVLISHNHYDHLCEDTVTRLHRFGGEGEVFGEPEGIGERGLGVGWRNWGGRCFFRFAQVEAGRTPPPPPPTAPGRPLPPLHARAPAASAPAWLGTSPSAWRPGSGGAALATWWSWTGGRRRSTRGQRRALTGR